MHLIDTAMAPKGHFRLWVRRKGVLVPELCMDEPNLIVNGSKQIHAKLLGGDVANQSVTQIAFGTNGAAPAGTDTVITGAYTKGLDGHSYPSSSSVQFAFSLGSGENNGMGILEFGLITAGGGLYARRTRSVALNKDTDLSFNGTWTINF